MEHAVYDMDGTILKRASWTPWLFHFAATEAPWRLLLAPLLLVPLLAFVLRLIGRKGLKQATQRLMMGRRVPAATVAGAADRFAERFGARHELAGALAEIAADRAAGRRLVLATASPAFYVGALARRWGFDAVVATGNVWVEGGLTPAIRGENCYGMGKLRMVLESLPARPAHVKALSDHASDLPLLLWADEAVAANPTAALRRAAAAAGWRVGAWG